jgi:hypothetical protein
MRDEPGIAFRAVVRRISTAGMPVDVLFLLVWGGKMLFATKRLHF